MDVEAANATLLASWELDLRSPVRPGARPKRHRTIDLYLVDGSACAVVVRLILVDSFGEAGRLVRQAQERSACASGLMPVPATIVDPNGGRAQEYYDNSPDFAGATPINITAGGTATIDAALGLPPR